MLHRLFSGAPVAQTEFGFLTASDVDLSVFMPPVREEGVAGIWLSSGASGESEITSPGLLEINDDVGIRIISDRPVEAASSVSGMWLSSGASGPSTTPEPPPEPPPVAGLAVGARTDGPPPTGEDAYTSSIGRYPDVNGEYAHGDAHFNKSWSWLIPDLNVNGNLDNYSAWYATRTRRMDLALGMCSWVGTTRSNTTAQGAFLGEVAAGTHDAKFREAARKLRDTYPNLGNRPLYIRLGHEMNLNFPWGVRAVGLTTPDATKTANYKGAWQKIHDAMMDEVSSINWRWVFCPLQTAYYQSAWWGSGWLDAVWPGDDYVDLVGSDHYDADGGYSTVPTDAQRLAVWNGNHLTALTRMNTFAEAHGKPQCLNEWGVWHRISGTTNGGDDNPLYIENMFNWVTTHNFEYVVYFNRNNSLAESSLTNFGTVSKANARAMYINTFGQLPHPF